MVVALHLCLVLLVAARSAIEAFVLPPFQPQLSYSLVGKSTPATAHYSRRKQSPSTSSFYRRTSSSSDTISSGLELLSSSSSTVATTIPSSSSSSSSSLETGECITKPRGAKNAWEVHKFGGASLATAELYRTVGDLLIQEAAGRGESGGIPTMA
jgi:hypothetical protein